MSDKRRQAVLNRQTVDRDALDARDASYANPTPTYTVDPDFKLVSAYRNALVNWSRDCPDVDGSAIVERFNADLGLSDNITETIQGWQAWCCDIMDALDERDQAQVELDGLDKSPGRGSMGHTLQATSVAIVKEDAQEVIDRIKTGPAIGGEGVEFDDPNYLPFSGKDEGQR